VRVYILPNSFNVDRISKTLLDIEIHDTWAYQNKNDSSHNLIPHVIFDSHNTVILELSTLRDMKQMRGQDSLCIVLSIRDDYLLMEMS